MSRNTVGSLAIGLIRLSLREGVIQQQQQAAGLASQLSAAPTLVSLRSFNARAPLEPASITYRLNAGPSSIRAAVAAGASVPARWLTSSQAAGEQATAPAAQQQEQQVVQHEETIEEIRARIFGYHVGNGQRSGRKVLRGALKGPRVMEWYPEDPTRLDPMMPSLEAERAKLKLDRLRRRGKAPPKKGQGKRSGKKK